MSETQQWDVPCYVCGHKLGSNKATCGQAKAGKKAVRFPPCVWAHTDDKYVRRAFAEADEAEKRKKKDEEEANETYQKYMDGVIDFSEGTGFPDGVVITGMDVDTEASFLEGHGSDGAGDQGRGEGGDERRGRGAAEEADAAESGKDNGGKIQKHTKWTSKTRTMFYKCIQVKDPFHTGHKDKTPAWEGIAAAMQEATKHLGNTEEGDLRCYGSGKTLQVFYGRMKRAYKERDEDDKHSGGAGRQDNDDPSAQMKKEEREQLFACMELEKEADGQVQLKRDAAKSYDYMKNGLINDFVVECATKDEKVKPKLVKELSSRLRQAKMRKMAFEESNKGGTYTYTAEDMENFRLWDKLRASEKELPNGDDLDADIPASKKGGQLVNALKELTAQGAQLRQHFTPMSPQEFAIEFFKAKRAHAEATALTLSQKLAMVDKDVREKAITSEEGEQFKKRIKDQHYTFASP